MVLLELPSHVQDVVLAEDPELAGNSWLVSCKLKESIVTSISTGRQFRDNKLVCVFLAAYHTLLYRYNPSNEFVTVGLPVGKPRISSLNGVTNLQGANKDGSMDVPSIRVRFASQGDDGDEENADSGNNGAPEANTIGNVSFVEVLAQVEEAFPGNVDAEARLCEAGFEFCRSPVSTSRREEDTFKFEIFLRLCPGRDGSICAQFEYNAELCDKFSMTRFAHNYVQIVESLVTSPEAVDMPVYLLQMLAGKEGKEVLDQFSKRSMRSALESPIRESSLIDILERQARRYPDAIAVIDKQRSLTYLELYNRAKEVASVLLTTPGLRNQNNTAGQLELVGLGLGRGHEWVVAMAGVLMARMAYCPLDPQYPKARIEKLVAQAEINAVLSNVDCIDSFSWLEREDKARVFLLEDLKGSTVDLKALEEAKPTGSDACYVLFTSCSTGEPKGVVVEHQGVFNMVRSFRNILPRESPDVRGQLSAITFDLHAMDVYCTFDAGGTVAICDKEDLLTDLQGFIRQHLVKGIVITPTVAALLHPDEVPSLKWLAFGGEAVPRGLIKKWIGAGRIVIDHYGPTECSVAAACQLWRPGDEVKNHIGQPLDGVHIYILGPNLELLPIGIPGELCIAGVQVSRGYLKQPDLTARSFKTNPYGTGRHDRVLYKTGDRCRWLPEGNIQFLGRMDFQIKIRGNRVEPGEIEDHISKVDGVARCVVIMREDEPDKQFLVAYMMINDSASPETISGIVRNTIALELPSYMVPSAFVVMDELPQTMSGKVDRKLLPKPSLQDFELRNLGDQPEEDESCSEEEELSVALVFANVLGLPDVSMVTRGSSFFSLGGNSFLALQVVAHLHQEFGLPPSTMTIRQFFEKPTVGEIAEILKIKQKETFLTPDEHQQKLVQAHLQKRHHNSPSLNGVVKIKGSSGANGTTGRNGEINDALEGDDNLDLSQYLNGSGKEESFQVLRHHHVAMHVPLSYAQEVMWLVLHILPKPEVVDISDVWRLTGSVDVSRLENSIQQLLQRHQALRMRIVDRPNLGSSFITTVLNRWGPKVAANDVSASISRITSAMAGALGPFFLRNMHSLIPKFVDQIEQDHTIVPFKLITVDLEHPESSLDGKWELRRALDEARRPFDMNAAQGLLFRVTLIRSQEGESILVCMFNHLIIDGISAAIFYKELEYVFQSGTTDGLPEVASYSDYVAWESEWLASGAEKKELTYWSKLLGKDPEQLRLQTKTPRSFTALPCRGSWLDFSLNSSVRAALEEVSKKVGATLNMALLAAFHVLLHIWTNQRRIIVGTLLARRPLGEHQRMLGHVVDIIPIVADFRPASGALSNPTRSWFFPSQFRNDTAKEATMGLSYKDVLLQVKDRVLEGLENQSVTFRHIVCEVLSKPDFAKSALIQAYFNFLQPGTNGSPHSLNLGEAHANYDLNASWAREGEAAFTPVCLDIRQQQDGSLKGRLVYQADVFDRSIMEAMMLQYCNVIYSSLESPPNLS